MTEQVGKAIGKAIGKAVALLLLLGFLWWLGTFEERLTGYQTGMLVLAVMIWDRMP